MLDYFAHAGELHSTGSESAVHWLDTWYIGLPIFLLCTAGLAAVVYLVSKKSLAATYLSVVAVFLVSGIFLYDKAPIISTVTLTAGLFGSVLVVLTSLGAPESKKKPKK